jgi:hypothetical protein
MRRRPDLLLHNEKAGEIEPGAQNHLRSCPQCAADWESRKRVQANLKTAVEKQYAPSGLDARIRKRLRVRERRSWLSGNWPRLALITAASLAICVAVWLTWSREHLPALSDRPAQNAFIQRVSAPLTSVVKVGLGDHIHCSIFRRYPKDPPTIQQMEKDLGPSYKGLLPLVKASVPAEYKVIMAHQCGYGGRKYIHFTFSKGEALLSLVITRKQSGESLTGIPSAAIIAGIPLYQSKAQRFQIASFDTGQYFTFVVSDLGSHRNLEIASDLAPKVHDFLANVATRTV